MKIFITGGNGMVGKNLLEHPFCKRHEIMAPSRKNLDLTKKERILSFLKDNEPDLIIHCAGLVGGIHANIANPSGFLFDNLEIGCNLISAAASMGIKKLINLGSSCMYPRNALNPLKEDQLLQGELEPTNEGYALAKVCAQRLCQYLTYEDSSLQYITLMPCNLYGKYDNFSPERSHLIASIIRKLHHAKSNNLQSVDVWGDGTVRREFMLASDLADAVWFCVNLIDRLPNVINVGVGSDRTILEYFLSGAKVIGYDGKFNFDTTKPAGMKQKLLDVSKLSQLGWESKTSLEDGLKTTYDHYLYLKN
tara:strand:- start:906 stop:1826 length:921 start_codon:yes stop_codon:yes gene_type:complete